MTIFQGCPKSLSVYGKIRQGKISFKGDARPPMIQIQEEGSSGPLGENQTGAKWGKASGDLVLTMETPQPSLWSESSFSVVKFTGCCLPFPENFPNDYQSLHNKSLSYLTRLLEVKMLRCLLVKRVQRENHIQTTYEFNSQFAFVIWCLQEH